MAMPLIFVCYIQIAKVLGLLTLGLFFARFEEKCQTQAPSVLSVSIRQDFICALCLGNREYFEIQSVQLS